MIDATQLMIDALVEEVSDTYVRMFGAQAPHVPEIVRWGAELSLEHISRSDALYHDVEHTLMATSVGAELLRARHLVMGGVTPSDWLHVLMGLLLHDIGFVRGVVPGDQPGAYVAGTGDERLALPRGATDASLQPWHVDRGIHFARERFGGHELIDAQLLAANIDYTRFPVPEDPKYHETRSFRAMVRAADLIGQLADPHYLRKLPALFREMEETGQHEALGFETPDDLRDGYPRFYEQNVAPWIQDALGWLRVTARGRRWLAALQDHVDIAAQRRARR